MRPSPMKQDPKLTFGACLLMLCLLFLALTPAASAARVHADRRAQSRMRGMMRIENGIVTDDDGIIGNSATGADHARHVRRPRPAHMMTGSDIPSSPLDPVPGLPQNGTDGDMNGTLGDTADGGMNGNTNGTAEGDTAEGGPVKDGTDMLPDPTVGDVRDDTDGNVANDTANGTDDTASSVLPWIIGIIVLLAVVLIVLSLMPKKKRNT